MKTKLLGAALLVSAALLAPAWAGGGNHGGGGGGGHFAASGRGSARSGGGPSFQSMPMRSFGGNRMMSSGQRFSSVGRSRSMEFRPHYVNSNANGSLRTRQFSRGNINEGNRNARFANAGNRGGQIRNGNNLRPGWQNHVVAQHSGNWHRDWDRRTDHWWNGHRCHFFNGAWFIFDFGFDPWWPYWYYPSGSYAYGYTYDYDQSYYEQGAYDQGAYYGNNGYEDQSSDSVVVAAQQRLARDGYYRGQIDGVFGPETRAAIAQFQSNHGLRVTGALTTDTLQALGLRQVASY